MIYTMIQGLAMALADSVPGVSGSTIAFIMGFYERFLTALHNFFGKDKVLRKEAAFYLLKFAIGWIVGICGSILILSRIFENHVYFLCSMFLGLVIAAIPFIVYEEKWCMKGKYKYLLCTFIGVAVVILLTILRSHFSGMSIVDFSELMPAQYIYLVICGLLTISAMLLPGISGSTTLLILGAYVPTITAFRNLFNLNMEYLPGIIAFAVGVLIGIIFIARLIRRCLRRFRPQMMYLITGLLLGSIYAITMGPTTLTSPCSPVSLHTFNILAFCIGIAVLVALELWKRYSLKKDAASDDNAASDGD